MKRLMKRANKMQLIYSLEAIPKQLTKSIFLAGPTPRSDDVESWRPEAIKLLEKLGYDGVVYIPETRDGHSHDHYDDQIDWERKCLDAADCIVFWIDRKKRNDFEMIALTTNIEYGLYCKSGKVVAGAPVDAPKNNYLKDLAKKQFIKWEDDLESTLKNALEIIGEGALRKDGECLVPLIIWNHESFQNWYKAQTSVGNELRNLKTEYTFIMPKARLLFLWICHVEVYIKAEDRMKTNEFVLSRTNLSTVLMYYPGQTIQDTKVLLIKEFRSPVCNSEEFVYELPGGSSNESKPADKVAVTEVFEETGLKIDGSRLIDLGSRQACATLSAHKIFAYALELKEEEIKDIESKIGEAHGNFKDDSELTYIEVKTVQEILDGNLVDWNNIGIILNGIITNI